MARTKNPAPPAARSAPETATNPAPAPVAPAVGGNPASTILAALSAEPGGATVTVIAGHAGISAGAARQALIAHEKAGTATRVKGERLGVPDTWKPADPASATEARGAEGTGGRGDGTAAGGEIEAGTAQRPDPAVTAEAAGNALAVAHAADDVARPWRLGTWVPPWPHWRAAREQAAQGRRVIKAAASGRHASATRPGALRDLVEEHLLTFPDAAFTPHQVGKVLKRSVGAIANALDKLTALGTAQMVTDKPRNYRLTPALTSDAVGPGASAEPRPAPHKPHNVRHASARGRDGRARRAGHVPTLPSSQWYSLTSQDGRHRNAVKCLRRRVPVPPGLPHPATHALDFRRSKARG